MALDTLAWGGLVPSRQSGNDLAAALARLETLARLKLAHPELKLMAYSSIQRVSRDNDDGEEPAYFKQLGSRIFRRSELEHRAVAGALEGDEVAELETLRREVPEAVWNDQLAIRERTLEVNLSAIELVERGVIDTLVLNQDDTTVWGINVMNRQRLEREVRSRRLGERVFVYPGADEVSQVLIARLAAQVHGRRPLAGVIYSSRGGESVQTGYEDRPLGDLITVHLRAAGAVQAPGTVSPDWWLAVNSPSRSQGQGGLSYALEHGELHAAEREWIERSEANVIGLNRSLESFHDALEVLLASGARVSVADVAYVNGGDDELLSALAAAGTLELLAGYGGWNTAGNSLGSAVALGCIAALTGGPVSVSPQLSAEHDLAVAARFVDDWLYQARVRSRLLLDPVLKPYGWGGFMPDADLPEVEERARVWLNEDLAAFDLPYRVKTLRLPWKRTFEIGYEIERVGAEAGAEVGSEVAG